MVFGPNPSERVIGAVNSGIDQSEFEKDIKLSHNAIQMELMDQMVRGLCVGLAETEMVDTRNERAVNQAREICHAMGWEFNDPRQG
jgi:hypothetical protein